MDDGFDGKPFCRLNMTNTTVSMEGGGEDPSTTVEQGCPSLACQIITGSPDGSARVWLHDPPGPQTPRGHSSKATM